jgi:hypothetical protein
VGVANLTCEGLRKIMLTVTNGNDFNFAGRFNSVDFSFPAGKTTALPEDAARHIFGVGLADKTDVLVRHGWMQSGAGFAAAMAILNKFSFNVADQVEPGEIIDAEIIEEPADEENEQGSAPLQTGSAVEAAAPDGAVAEAAQPTPSEPVEEDQGGVLGFFKKGNPKKGS